MVEGVTPQVLANCHCRNSWGLIALQARNQAGTIWIWNERQNRLCKRADARLGNDVARKRLACLGIWMPFESTKLLKSPFFMAAVGTVPMAFCAWFWVNLSRLNRKKVRFFP